MILSFAGWRLSPNSGTLGYQFDNLTRELVVQGDLPEGWEWDVLVSAGGNDDIWPLTLGDGRAYATLTDDNLSVSGEYYLQLRGTQGELVRHTNIVKAHNFRSLSGAGKWPTYPTEWIQAEKDIKELNAHPPVPGEDGYWQLWDLTTHSYQPSQLVVPGLSIQAGTVTTLAPDAPATAEVVGEGPDYILNLGIPRGEDGVQINDEAVNTTETWSSKKLLDTLCPPFTETGNPITCHPVEDYPLDVTVTVEPIQSGTGDPSPDNVRPITGRDSVQVTRCGKNLLKLTGRTVQSVPADFQFASENAKYPVGDGYLYVGIASNGYWSPSNVLEYDIDDNSISVQVMEVASGYGIGMCVKIVPGENYVVGKGGDDTNAFISALTTKKDGLISRFTVFNTEYDNNRNKFTAQDGEEWAIVIFRPNPNALVTYQNPQLELSSTPTAYEPYQGSTTTLTLPETIYGGEVDAVSGVGSKEWGYIASYNGETLPAEWISDRDVYAAGTTPTTGAQVAYKLATPESFQATGNQPIPALAGENTVYTDGDSLTVSGRTDPLSTIQTMQAQITALQDQITQGGTT